MLAVTLCEESVEVSVDNEPNIDPRVIELQYELKTMKAKIEELSLENNRLKAKYDTLSAERDKKIDELNDKLKRKEVEKELYSIKLDKQHEKLLKLQFEKEELQKRYKDLQKNVTFLDFMIDITERYVIPAAAAVWGKIVETWDYAKSCVFDIWRRIDHVWMTNESLQRVKKTVAHYWIVSSDWCVDMWSTKVQPYVMVVIRKVEPTYVKVKGKVMPVVTPYLEEGKRMTITFWMHVKTQTPIYAHKLWASAVAAFETFYNFLKSSPASQWTDLIAYLVLVSVMAMLARVVIFLVLLPICLLCPCRRCTCSK